MGAPTKITVDLISGLFAALGALIAGGTSKTTPVDADTMPIADSAASNATKSLSWANLKATLWAAWGALIAGGTSKATPVDGDSLPLSDSAASNASKKLTWANLKAALKTYLDTLYMPTSTLGTWTPTITAVGNVDGTPTGEFHYHRIGGGAHVHCWGYIAIDPTAGGGASTSVDITLPVASNFSSTGDLRGVIVPTSAQRGGSVHGDVAGDKARFVFASEGTATITFSFMFDYEIKA